MEVSRSSKVVFKTKISSSVTNYLHCTSPSSCVSDQACLPKPPFRSSSHTVHPSQYLYCSLRTWLTQKHIRPLILQRAGSSYNYTCYFRHPCPVALQLTVSTYRRRFHFRPQSKLTSTQRNHLHPIHHVLFIHQCLVITSWTFI